MPTTITASATNDTFEPNKAQRLFRASNGDLIVVWSEPTSPYVRRAVSPDGGVTWARKDPTSLTFTTRAAQVTPNLIMCANGDTIYGFNFDYFTASTSAQMFKFVYSTATRTFTDSIAYYTWTSQPVGNKSAEDGEARYDAVRSTIHVCFTAINAAVVSSMYVIAFSPALAKITELNFASGAGPGPCASMRLDSVASPKVYLAYQGGGSLKYRSYTWNGATYTAADGEEIVVTPAVSPSCAALALDAAGLVDFVWDDGAGNLQTRKRTGVATYSGITTLATDFPSGSNSGQKTAENIGISETGNTNADIWVFYKSVGTYDAGEIRYVRRNNGAWGATALLSGASAAGRNGSCPITLVQSDGYIHIVFAAGNDLTSTWSVLYSKLAIGAPSAPTGVSPSGNGGSTATPQVTATYVQNKAADNLGKYRVEVQRVSDSVSFWDTGAAGTAWAGAAVAPGGAWPGVTYAGTALVKGTQYKVRVTFWDAVEGYAGTASAFTNFSWNDPPVVAAPSITADATNGRNRIALYPLAPVSGTTVVAAAGAIMRRVGSAAFAAIKSALAFTAATTQTGFIAYRQLPEKIARNLVINGGFIVGTHAWQFGIAGSTNVGTAIADALSPTGYALRAVTSLANQNFGTQFFSVEPGKPYSLAFQARTDGVAPLNFYMQWLDVAGNTISQVHVDTSSTAYVELNLTNQVAPGNARQLALIPFNPTTPGILFVTAIRLMQQTTAPAAWTSAHQQYRAQGLAIYEASTNLVADGDMEAVGIASYTAVTATLTKDTGAGNFFAGAKGLKLVTTAIDGRATQNVVLAAGQPATVSVRCKGGDGTTRLQLFSLPSNTLLGTVNNPNTTDWNALRVSGTVVGGDTSVTGMLVGGGNAVTSYWDNFALENKAYDTMNADPSGQAFALAARTVSALVIPVPAALVSTSDVTMLAVVRCDTANATRNSEALSLQIDGNNFVTLTLNGTQPQAQRDRAGTLVTTVVGGAVANGDTVSMAVRWRVGVGLSLYWSANGGAVTQVDVTSEESKLAPVGAPTGIRVGGSGASLSINGTVGVVRVLAAGLSDATISALVLNPYADPSANDLAVWAFDGATYQVPTFNDRLIKLGTAYDYRADTTAAAATPTSSTGQVESATLAWDPTTLWWLKAATTESLDTQLDVIDSAPFTIPRTSGVLEPINSNRKVVQRGAQAFGDEGHVHAFHRTLAEQTARIASLRALQASNEQLYLQTPFNELKAITIVGGVALDPKDNTLGVDLDYIETA